MKIILFDKNPVPVMEGYGTFNLPPGYWSDDSSLTIAASDGLSESKAMKSYDSTDNLNDFID